MTDTYIALLRKEADSDYGVEFPDLPGCVTAGTSLDDAAAMAREALDFHLEGLAEEGQPRPEPSALADILTMAESSGAVPILVPAAKPKGRATRVSVTIEENLLAAIDAEAGPGGRSGFLAQAAQSALGIARTSDNLAKTIDVSVALQRAFEKATASIPVIESMKKFEAMLPDPGSGLQKVLDQMNATQQSIVVDFRAMLTAPDSGLQKAFDQINAAQQNLGGVFEAMQRRMDDLPGNKTRAAQPRKLAKRVAGESRPNPARKGQAKA